MSLKMGDFNTPSVFRFFKRKRRFEIYYLKPPHGYLYFVRAHRYQPPKQRFFYYAVVLAEVLNYYQNASADTIETLPFTVPKVPSGAWRYSL